MADNIESRIDLNIDVSNALASIKTLQAQISAFHQSIRNSGNAVNQAVSDNLTKNLLNNINATQKFSASLTTVSDTTQSFTNALEKNKLSLGQYFKYGAASTQSFGRLFKKEFDTIEKVARDRVKTVQTQFIRMGRDSSGALEAIRVRPLRLDMEQLGTQVAMTAQKQQLFNQLVKQGSTNLLNFGKNTQWAGRQLMVGFTIPLSIMGGMAIKEFDKIERQAIRFKRVYGDAFTTDAETDAAIENMRRLATEFTKYGIEVEKTLELAADVAQMGLRGSELTAQVTEATRLAVLGEVEQQEALKATISVTNAFGVAAEELAGKIDFLNAVENETLTAISDLTIAIPKAGPVVKQLGGDVEDLAFFLTAMKEGGINASEGANALKSGLAKLINPTEKASLMLQGFGINLTQIVEQNAGDIRSTVMQFANALDALDPLNRARAIEELFGRFQFARISTLFENIGREGSQAQRVLELANKSSAELAILSERELKRIEDSPVFQLQKAIEKMQEALAPLGAEFIKIITPLIEFGTKVLKSFNGMSDGAKAFVTNIITVLGLIAPIAIMTFGLLANGLANFIKGINFVRTGFGKLAGAGTGLNQMTQYMTMEQLEATAAASSLGQAHSALTTVFTSERTALDGLIRSYNNAILAMRQYNATASQTRTRPGGKTRGYAEGVVSVPGPRGAGDIIPAMLSPGEAVIPAKEAQRYRGLISAIISGKIPGFAFGNDAVGLNVSQSDKETIISEANRLAALGDAETNVAKQAMQSLLEKKRQSVKEWRRIVALIGSEEGSTPSQTLGKTIDYGDTPSAKKQKKKDISKFRGSQAGTAASRAVQYGRQEEYEVAGTVSKAAHESLISQGMSPAKASQVSGYMGPNNPGVAMGHKADVGSGKVLPEGWQSEFVNFDPRMENTILSSMTTASGEATTKIYDAYSEAAEILVQQGDIAAQEWTDLKSAILSDRSFTEGERRTFDKVNKRVAKDKAGTDIGVQATALSAGYDAADIQNIKGYQQQNTPEQVRAAEARLTAAKKAKLGSGITPEQIAKIEEDGRNLIDGLLKAIDQAADMQSPSREMFERGKNLVRGMVDGVQEEIRRSTGQASPPKQDLPKPPSLPGFEQVETPKVVNADLAKGKSFGKKFVNKTEAFLENQIRGDGIFAQTKMAQNLNEAFEVNEGKYDEEFLEGAKTLEEAKEARIAKEQLLQQVNDRQIDEEAQLIEEETINLRHEDGSLKTRRELIAEEEALQKRKAQAEKRAQRQNLRAERKLVAQDRAQKRQARAGKALGVLGSATMVAGMATQVDGVVGETAQKILPGLAGLSAIAPILLALPGPLALLAAGLGALAATFFMSNKAIDDARKSAIKLNKELGSSKDRMQSFAEISGSVTGTEIMDRAGENQLSLFPIASGKATFGMSFMESDQGKQLLQAAQDFEKAGGEGLSDMIYSQLRDAVLAGALDTSQARSIATQLSNQLKDYKLGVDVQGRLTDMFGPNGESLLTPDGSISIRMRAVLEAQGELSNAITNAIASGTFNYNPTDLGNRIKVSLENVLPFLGSGENDKLNQYQTQIQSIVSAFSDNFAALGSSLDQLDAGFLREMDLAKQQGDVERYAQIEQRWLTQRNKLISQYSDTVENTEQQYINLIDRFVYSEARMSPDEAAAEILKQQNAAILSNFEEGSKEYKNAEELINKLDKLSTRLDSKPLVFTLKSMYESEDLSSTTMETITALLESDQELKLDGVVGLTSRVGTRETERVFQIANMFVDENGKPKRKMQSDFVLNALFSAPEDVKGYLDTFVTASKLGYVVDTQLIFEALVDDPEKLAELNSQLTELDKLDTTKKMTVEYIQKTTEIGSTTLSRLKADQEYFEKLDPLQQVTYIQTVMTLGVAGEMALPEYQTWSAENAKRSYSYDPILGPQFQSTPGSFDDYIIAMSQMLTKIREAAGLDTNEGNGLGSGSSTDPLEGILSKLKEIRNAAINAGGGVKELLRVLGDSAKEMQTFRGVSQKLLAAGFTREFINAVMSMDESTRETFVSIKNGVISVTEAGRALNKAFSEAALGEYQNSIAQNVIGIGAQIDAMNKLVAAGVSVQDASEIVKDQNFAIAIASQATAKEVRDLANAFEEQAAAQKQLALTTPEGRQSELESVISEANAFFSAQETFQNQRYDAAVKAYEDANGIVEAQRDLADKEFKLDDLSYALDQISKQEEKVNDEYDKREEAIENIYKANKAIIDQDKEKLNIADALASGDLAAAAKAMREQSTANLERNKEAQLDNLQRSRELELAQIRDEQGRSRLELETQIKDIQQEIAEIQENKLEPYQRELDLLDRVRQDALKDVQDTGFLGLTQARWAEIANEVERAKFNVDSYMESLKTRLNAIPGVQVGEDGSISVDENQIVAPEVSPEPTTTDDTQLPATNPNQEKIDELNRLILITRKRVREGDYTDNDQKQRLIRINMQRIRDVRSLGGIAAAMGGLIPYMRMGGLLPYKAEGGSIFKSLGTDTVPAMLTPGEFVVRRHAVSNFGVDKLRAINSGTYNGESVYNYSVNVNVKSDANPDEIARSVMGQIKRIDSQRIRGNKF